MDKLTYSASEAALKIGMSKSKTLHMLDSGELPGIRIGRNWLVPEKALVDWLCDRAYIEARERRISNGKA